MGDKYNEDYIFQTALQAAKKNFAFTVDFVVEETEEHLNRDLRVDKVIRMVTHDREIRFFVEIKANINNATIAQLLILKERLGRPFLLVTTNARTQIAEKLKQQGIEFIDAAGNTYINQPPIYIFVNGNRLPETFRQDPKRQAVLKTTGLKVIFAFLCNPGLENKPYREIAEVAGVALGTVGRVMKDLKDLGYLMPLKTAMQKFKMIQKEDLLNRWVNNYQEKLKDRLILGCFRGPEGWWKDLNFENARWKWGGEVAAAKLTKYLKPQLVTIYTDPFDLNELLLKNKLKRDNHGDIEVIRRFWKPLETCETGDTVHPILIYADLMTTGNQRNIETAKEIFERYVIRYIREG